MNVWGYMNVCIMNVWGYTEILLIIVIELVIYIKKSFICFKKYFENNSSKIIKSPRHSS